MWKQFGLVGGRQWLDDRLMEAIWIWRASGQWLARMSKPSPHRTLPRWLNAVLTTCCDGRERFEVLWKDGSPNETSGTEFDILIGLTQISWSNSFLSATNMLLTLGRAYPQKESRWSRSNLDRT